MRYHELLEYKRDITISNFGDKIVALMHNDPDLRDSIVARQPDDEELYNEFFEVAEEADPTPNKIYVRWIVYRFLDKSITRFEDISSTIAEFLLKYHSLKVHNRLNDPADGAPTIPTDINQIKTSTDISTVHAELTPKWNRLNQELGKRLVKSKGKSTEVYKDDQVRVIVPMNKEAACYYGQGTQWCTASSIGKNHFDNYNERGRLYILIPINPKHTGEKYQLHFASGQYMDEHDRDVSLFNLLQTRFDGSDVGDLFLSLEPSIKKMVEFTPKSALMDIVDVMVDWVKNKVIPPIIEDVTERNHVDYFNWLEEGGFLYKDKKNNVKVKDGAPSYLEYDKEFQNVLLEVMDIIDVNYEEIMQEVALNHETGGSSYSTKYINEIMRDRLVDERIDRQQRNDKSWGWLFDNISKTINSNLTTDIDYDKNNNLIGFNVRLDNSDSNDDSIGQKEYT